MQHVKSSSSVAKCRPTILIPTQSGPIAKVWEYPTDPTILIPTQSTAIAEVREYPTNPSIPKPTQTNPIANVREYPTNPSIPKPTQIGNPTTGIRPEARSQGHSRPTVTQHKRHSRPTAVRQEARQANGSPTRGQRQPSKKARQPNSNLTTADSSPTTVRQQSDNSRQQPSKKHDNNHKSGANITLTPLSQCNHKPNRPMQQAEFSRSPNQASHLVGSMTSLPPM